MICKRRYLATGIATAAALLLSSCGGGGGTGTASDGASGKPVAGGSATVLTPSDSQTLDPARMGNNFASGGMVGNALYGTLLVDAPSSGKIRPSMAESFVTKDGGKTFELKLRAGLKFTDGNPLDAAAVKYNWDRMRRPATASPYLSDASMVASTKAVDATTLRVTMAQPVAQFAQSVVTSSLNWIASPAALKKGAKSFDAKPVGAGPYTVKEWRRQSSMVLAKNPQYWDSPKPYLDTLTLRVSLDSAQRINTMTSGGADLAIETNMQNLVKAKEAGLPTNTLPLSGGTYLALNTRKAPFNDVRARAAVAAAVDTKSLNESVFEGDATPVATLFDKSSPLYADIPASSPDKSEAQRLFDDLAKDGKRVSFTLTTTSATENRSLGEAFQAQLSKFDNVSVKIKVVDFSEFLTLQTTHDFNAAVTSAAFRDPEPRLWTAFHSDEPTNMSGVADKKLDAALLAGRTATSVEDRKDAYEQVQKRLTALHPMLWIVRTGGGAIAKKNVGGMTQYGFSSLLPEELWIKK
ncbi:ABC transporter substrate-binding protein [Streptomyces sp. NPDC102364]|uniref:ABC transporter substrate-binding protein n=1 Tax=Streptomyces sp. NPDC102364 TaxID=3366161 RepID=UPI0037F565F4